MLLRRREKADFVPRPGNIFQERLYCIQWITRESIDKGRQTTFFAPVGDDDLARELRVYVIVGENLAQWQFEGMTPDMLIEPGDETARLIRERGWTHWHHLFNPRQLLGLSVLRRAISQESEFRQAALILSFCIALDNCSKLCTWNAGHPGSGEYTAHVFYNQALNPFFSYTASLYAADLIPWRQSDFDGRAAHVVAFLPATVVREGRLLYDASAPVAA